MIYVLGAGNIGCLVATELIQKSAVSFIMRPKTLSKYLTTGESTVRIFNKFVGSKHENTINAVSVAQMNTPLKQLVLAVKSTDVFQGLKQLKHLITKETEIVIFHNGMGVSDLVHSLWTSTEMPNVAYGVTDAGVKRTGPLWDFEYTGNGVAYVANSDTRENQLCDSLSQSADLLNTEKTSLKQFTAEQKYKLVVNSVINPLTALLGCNNGALKQLGSKNTLIPQLVSESCRALNIRNDETRILGIVENVIEKTSSNTSSMLRDIECGQYTEIDFINGYIVKQAKELGFHAPMNYMLLSLVQMRLQQIRNEADAAVPWENKTTLQGLL